MEAQGLYQQDRLMRINQNSISFRYLFTITISCILIVLIILHKVIDESSETGNVIQPIFEGLVKEIEQESQSKEHTDTCVAERGGKGKSKSDKKKERNMEQLVRFVFVYNLYNI